MVFLGWPDGQVFGLTGPWRLAEKWLRLASGNVCFLEFCVIAIEAQILITSTD
jgi:hypothetical protein